MPSHRCSSSCLAWWAEGSAREVRKTWVKTSVAVVVPLPRCRASSMAWSVMT